MKKRQWLLLTLGVIIIAALLLVACGEPEETKTTTSTTQPTTQPTTTPADEPQYGGTLKIITSTLIPAFGPPVNTEGSIYPLALHGIYETLTSYDNTSAFAPSLATSVDISPDGLTMTFHLRQGVKFHDGTDFDANAVKYHIENFQFLPFRFDPIVSMDIPDPYTIQFNLSEPTPTLVHVLGSLWGCINSPTAAQKEPSSPDNAAIETVAGAGPFKLVEWMRDVHIKMEGFDDYWDQGKPYLDGLEIIFIADPTTAMLSFEAGDAQVIRDLSPRNAANLRDEGFEIQSCVGYMFELWPDSKNPDSPFADKRVREAVEYAINKEDIVNSFGFGFIEAQYQSCTSNRNAYDPSLESRKYDPDKARQLLEDAGFSTGFDTTIYAQTKDDREILTAIQSYLADVGIRAKVDISEPAKFMEMGRMGWENGLRYYNRGVDIDFTATYYAFYRNESAHTFSMDKPKSMTDAALAAYHEPDDAKRRELLLSVTRTLHDEVLEIPLWTWPLLAAMSDSVHDLNLFTIDLHSWDATNAWLSD